jgi:hypothetical protein
LPASKNTNENGHSTNRKGIKQEVLILEWAEYGNSILDLLSQKLTEEFGYGEKCLRRMIQFYECYPGSEIVATLSRQLSWSPFVEIIPLDTDLLWEFYTQMCRIEQNYHGASYKNNLIIQIAQGPGNLNGCLSIADRIL